MATIKKQSLLNFVAARAEYLQLNIAAGMQVGSPEHTRMSNSTVTAMSTHIAATRSIETEQATGMISILTKAPLLHSDLEACLRMINEKVWLADTDGPAARQQLQTIDEPQMYLTSDDWACMMSPRKSVHERVLRLAARFSALGHFYPSESAARNIVALSLMDQGNPHSLVGEALKHIKSYKGMIKQQRQRAKNIAVYPMFDEGLVAFKTAYPGFYTAAYKDAEPIAPPIEVMAYKYLVSALGCRVTKTGAQQHTAWPAYPQIPQIWQRQMSAAELPLPGLHIFGQHAGPAPALPAPSSSCGACTSGPIQLLRHHQLLLHHLHLKMRHLRRLAPLTPTAPQKPPPRQSSTRKTWPPSSRT